MKLKLKAKLTLSFLLASVIPLLVLFVVSVQLSTNSLEKSSFERLRALQKAKAGELDSFFKTISAQVKSISGSSVAVEAFEELNTALSEVDYSKVDWAKVNASLLSYYNEKFKPSYDEQNSKAWAGAEDYVNALSKEAKYLQFQYISNNPAEVGAKHNTFDSGDGTKYSERHKYFHSFYKGYLESFNFYDIFLVDNNTGRIVYSVFKEVDYGTSLVTGPLKETGLAEVFNMSREASKVGDVFVGDMKKYLPSYSAPAIFLASPIFVDGSNSATLVFQVPIDKINEVMTGDSDWEGKGFGSTGEVFVVGKDKKMRSISRVFFEDTDSFLGVFQERYPEEVKFMKAKDTSSLGVVLDTLGTKNALLGKEGFFKYENHLGKDVLGSSQSIDIGGVVWGLVAEIGEEEAFADVNQLIFRNFMLMGFSVLVVIILSLFIAKSIANPISLVSKSIKKMAEGNLETNISVDNKDEVGEMVGALQDTLEKLRGIFKTSNVDWAEVEKQKEQVDKALNSAKMEAQKAGEALEQAKVAEEEANEAKEEAELLGLQQMKNGKELQSKVDEILAVVDQCKTGDLRAQISVEGEDAIGKVGGGLKSFFSDLKNRIEEINRNSGLMGSASEGLMKNSENMKIISTETLDLSKTVSDEASRVAHSINEVNNSTGQLSQSFREVAGHTGLAAELANKAVSETSSAMERISALEKRSQEIEEIIHVINTISRQTNLLALNATIEAARAGDAGKGFAVVANEVKELAGQTSLATDQIREKIELIQSGTSDVVQAIENSSKIVTEINEVTGGIASSVEEQSSVTTEISGSMNMLNQSVQDIRARMQEVLDLSTKTDAGVEDNKSASREFQELSRSLEELVSHFKVDEKATHGLKDAA